MLISNCESELQELMKQVDIMVHSKKLEWDRERQTLQTRLNVREEEYVIQKETLAQKHKEVSRRTCYLLNLAMIIIKLFFTRGARR